MTGLATLFTRAVRKLNAPKAKAFAAKLLDSIKAEDRSIFEKLLADEKSLAVMMNDLDLGKSLVLINGTGHVKDVTEAIVLELFNNHRPKLGLEFYDDFISALEKLFPVTEQGEKNTDYFAKQNYINLYPIFMNASFNDDDLKELGKNRKLLRNVCIRRMKLVGLAHRGEISLTRGHPMTPYIGNQAVFNRDFVMAQAEFIAGGGTDWHNKQEFFRTLKDFPQSIVLDALAMLGGSANLAAKVAENLQDYLVENEPRLSPAEQRQIMKIMDAVKSKEDKSKTWDGLEKEILRFINPEIIKAHKFHAMGQDLAKKAGTDPMRKMETEYLKLKYTIDLLYGDMDDALAELNKMKNKKGWRRQYNEILKFIETEAEQVPMLTKKEHLADLKKRFKIQDAAFKARFGSTAERTAIARKFTEKEMSQLIEYLTAQSKVRS